ncbi:MAG: outer membrane protein assembly factor BamA [Treponema sp.]|jgi:outer membrane protein insertion porin family|nr:outer membrane protein assembly factor BamA [Treponema sp.]
MRIVWTFVLAAVLVFSGFTQESDEWYQGKPVKDIVFNGLNHVKNSELRDIVEPYLGRIFTDDLFLEIQGRIYALEYFDLITPEAARGEGNTVVITFNVQERPVISRINFVGNNKLRRTELLNTISLKERDMVNTLKLQADEQAVINKYLEKGFPDVKVRSDTRPAANAAVTVNFYIDEGDKVTIEEFRFEGNTVFSSRALRRELTLKKKNLLLIRDGAFQESKLIADRDAITQYYRNQGYIDAEVIDVIQDVQKDSRGNNNMTITFRIYEGRAYNFGGISFEGNRIFSSEQLSKLVRSKPGEMANAQRLEADLQRVADLYYENGYIFNTIGREEERDTAGGIISYKITIVERGRAHIEHIIIRGNEKTKDNVILREIPLEPGDVFSKTKVMDGLRNLYNLQYFSNVIPDNPPGSTDSLMDLIITVEEQPTTDIQFGLTFSGTSDPDTFPIAGMIKWTDRNFLGYGNLVGAEINASPDSQRITLQYTQRWIFGLPLSGGFDFTAQHSTRLAAMDNEAPYFNGDEDNAYPDGFSSYEEYEDANKLPPDEYLMDYEQWSLSLGFSTGYRFSTFLGTLGVGGGVRTGFVLNLYDDELFRPFDPNLRENNNSWIPANSISTNVYLDQRDLSYDPSKGYYAIQRVGFYGLFPIEREHYIRTDTKAEWFYTLFDLPITDTYNFKSVFGIHSGVSFIFPEAGYSYGDPQFIEDANKLAVDGMFVGRGWTNQRLNRGLALWENWAEVRFPLVPGIIALDWFFDAAAVKNTPEDFFNTFTMNDMFFSFGAGIRFAIPQFPFRFIFAKGFQVLDGSVKWKDGNIWKGNKSGSGVDFVISFALSTY